MQTPNPLRGLRAAADKAFDAHIEDPKVSMFLLDANLSPSHMDSFAAQWKLRFLTERLGAAADMLDELVRIAEGGKEALKRL